ncbi:MAG: GGDEF domain-containing protein, partial [Planctomycetota bacterium]
TLESSYGSLEKAKEMEKKLELLSALREMSLAINEERDFETILSGVLHLAEVILHPLKIIIFLKKEETLTPRALRKAKQTFFHLDELKEEWEKEYFMALEALEKGQNRIYQQGMVEKRIFLLVAEKEIQGAMYFEYYQEDFDVDEANLRVLAKYLALAIRKPTLYNRAVVDSLTTLYTKGHFIDQLQKLFSMSQRLNKPFTLILMDIDHFKSINDTYGHLTGDLVLHEVGQTIKASIRDYDSAYRYGGEEMAILLPETSLIDGVAIAERIRKKVESLKLKSEDGQELRVTLSAGVASYESTYSSPKEMISKGDQLLYLSKKSGRNQVHPKILSTSSSRKLPFSRIPRK